MPLSLRFSVEVAGFLLSVFGVSGGFAAGVAAVFGVGVGFGVAGVGVAFGAGVAETFAFAFGVFGVGEGFTFALIIVVFAGTGTKITPLSFGINWLGLFGSIVII